MEATFHSEDEMMDVWPEMDSVATCMDDATMAESGTDDVFRDFD